MAGANKSPTEVKHNYSDKCENARMTTLFKSIVLACVRGPTSQKAWTQGQNKINACYMRCAMSVLLVRAFKASKEKRTNQTPIEQYGQEPSRNCKSVEGKFKSWTEDRSRACKIKGWASGERATSTRRATGRSLSHRARQAWQPKATAQELANKVPAESKDNNIARHNR